MQQRLRCLSYISHGLITRPLRIWPNKTQGNWTPALFNCLCLLCLIIDFEQNEQWVGSECKIWSLNRLTPQTSPLLCRLQRVTDWIKREKTIKEKQCLNQRNKLTCLHERGSWMLNIYIYGIARNDIIEESVVHVCSIIWGRQDWTKEFNMA